MSIFVFVICHDSKWSSGKEEPVADPAGQSIGSAIYLLSLLAPSWL
ncbi:hypothetical protein BJP36_43125 [Moorena producens JHB]|uniref:Uncharacterized protein n=1 Tax=Moorena producens (strain JHB) TaxID=1454205 RepID=A0A9Q9ST63_MOOP1|nr:hypothetical protein [Moorena producens]WAN69152.1 hypothetical protein BJP36_43125 [Moorena producens JHB]